MLICVIKLLNILTVEINQNNSEKKTSVTVKSSHVIELYHNGKHGELHSYSKVFSLSICTINVSNEATAIIRIRPFAGK